MKATRRTGAGCARTRWPDRACAPPVVPLEAPAIHAALPFREVVLEQLVDDLDARIVPGILDQLHPEVIQLRIRQLGLPPRFRQGALGGVPRSLRLPLPVQGEPSLGGGPRPTLEGVDQAGRDADEPGRGHQGQQGEQAGHDGPTPGPFPDPLGTADRPSGDGLPAQPVRQVLLEQPGARVAPPRVFFQALQADRIQVARAARGPAARRHGLRLHHQQDRVQGRGRLERRAAGDQGVERRTQRIDVSRRPRPLLA